jgi:hypothetical protein
MTHLLIIPLSSQSSHSSSILSWVHLSGKVKLQSPILISHISTLRLVGSLSYFGIRLLHDLPTFSLSWAILIVPPYNTNLLWFITITNLHCSLRQEVTLLIINHHYHPLFIPLRPGRRVPLTLIFLMYSSA